MNRRSMVVAGVAGLSYLITVVQRSSLGVAAIEASQRFHTNASQLAALSVAQLVLYAAMQIPVGVLLDRFGAKRLLIVGSIAMAGGQLLIAFATDFAQALSGRALVGFGDAFTFVTMLRLANSWFSGAQAARAQQILTNFGQLGQLLSAVPFAALLTAVGWTPAFSVLSAASLLIALLVLAIISDAPAGETSHRLDTVREVVAGLRANIRTPAVQLGFWTHFSAQSAGTVFALVWGVPYMVEGLGLSHSLASALLSILVASNIFYGPLIGQFCAKRPQHRHRLVIGVVVALMSIVSFQILWPSRIDPLALGCLLFAVGVGGPASMISFDYSRTFVSKATLGAANGFINVGGFIASSTMMALIGAAIDLRQKVECAAGSCGQLFSLDHFRVAFICEVAVIAFGLLMFVRTYRKLKTWEYLRATGHLVGDH